MATDKLLELRTSTTAQTGSTSATRAKGGTGINIPQGLAGTIMWIRIDVWEASGNTYTLKADSLHSIDGSTFEICYSGTLELKTLTATGQRFTIFVPITSMTATYFDAQVTLSNNAATAKWNARIVDRPF